MKIMTKNEYQAYLKECANRWYTDKSYTKEKFDADLDSVKIKDFDLSKYPVILPETEKWINILFREDDGDLLRGFTLNVGIEMTKLNLSYGNYANAYNFYAYNDAEMLIFTYCEGDTTLQPFATREEYEKAKKEEEVFYEQV